MNWRWCGPWRGRGREQGRLLPQRLVRQLPLPSSSSSSSSQHPPAGTNRVVKNNHRPKINKNSTTKKKKRKMRRGPLLGGLLYFRSSGSASVSEIQNCENSRCFSVVSVVSLLSWLTPLSLSSFFFFWKVSTFSFPLSNFRIISDDEVRKKEQRNGSAGIIAITAKMESKRGRNGAMGGG